MLEKLKRKRRFYRLLYRFDLVSSNSEMFHVLKSGLFKYRPRKSWLGYFIEIDTNNNEYIFKICKEKFSLQLIYFNTDYEKVFQELAKIYLEKGYTIPPKNLATPLFLSDNKPYTKEYFKKIGVDIDA